MSLLEVTGLDGYHATRRQALDQRLQEVDLPREVVVDEPLRHPRLLRDARCRRRREAALGEQRLGGGEDALARGLVIHQEECRTRRTAGATGASVVSITLTGTISGTLNYSLAVPAGASAGVTPLVVEFAQPIPASAVNTALTLNVPSFGAGNTNASAVLHGFYQ